MDNLNLSEPTLMSSASSLTIRISTSLGSERGIQASHRAESELRRGSSLGTAVGPLESSGRFEEAIAERQTRGGARSFLRR